MLRAALATAGDNWLAFVTYGVILHYNTNLQTTARWRDEIADMLRINGKPRRQLSNRLAVLAAALLALTAFAGKLGEPGEAGTVQATNSAPEPAENAADGGTQASESRRKLNLRLLLFRNG